MYKLKFKLQDNLFSNLRPDYESGQCVKLQITSFRCIYVHYVMCLILLRWIFVICSSAFCMLMLAGSYMFRRVYYIVLYQCDEASFCFVASILSKCCVVVELRCFVCFLKFCLVLFYKRAHISFCFFFPLIC